MASCNAAEGCGIGELPEGCALRVVRRGHPAQAGRRTGNPGLLPGRQSLFFLDLCTAGAVESAYHWEGQAWRNRALGRCEYCQLSQAGQEATFHIDHVMPTP